MDNIGDLASVFPVIQAFEIIRQDAIFSVGNAEPHLAIVRHHRQRVSTAAVSSRADNADILYVGVNTAAPF